MQLSVERQYYHSRNRLATLTIHFKQRRSYSVRFTDMSANATTSQRYAMYQISTSRSAAVKVYAIEMMITTCASRINTNSAGPELYFNTARRAYDCSTRFRHRGLCTVWLSNPHRGTVGASGGIVCLFSAAHHTPWPSRRYIFFCSPLLCL